MIASAAISALHLFALAIGLPGLYLRGRWLKGPDLPRVMAADAAWGIAAALWIVTGLARAFGGFEKGAAYYMHHNLFGLKMALFGLIWLLELYPMITLIRWRSRTKKQLPIDLSVAPTLRLLNNAELGVLICMPFIAAAMARGIGY